MCSLTSCGWSIGKYQLDLYLHHIWNQSVCAFEQTSVFCTFLHLVSFPSVAQTHICRGLMVHCRATLEFSFHSWAMTNCESAHPLLCTCLRAYVPISMETQRLKLTQTMASFLSVSGRSQHEESAWGVSVALTARTLTRLIDAPYTAVLTSKHTLAVTQQVISLAESSPTVYDWIFVL